MNRNLSNCEKARKKRLRGFNGIRTRGLCASAAVLYQPELWRPTHWRAANLLSSSTRERNETQNEMMWTAGIQMKWVCDHRSESQFKQLRKSQKKKRFRGFNVIRTCGRCASAAVLYQPELWRPIHWRPANLYPVEAPKSSFRAFSQLLKLRFTAMVTYSFHLYSRSSHHFILSYPNL